MSAIPRSYHRLQIVPHNASATRPFPASFASDLNAGAIGLVALIAAFAAVVAVLGAIVSIGVKIEKLGSGIDD
jgi:hypothetical protein